MMRIVDSCTRLRPKKPINQLKSIALGAPNVQSPLEGVINTLFVQNESPCEQLSRYLRAHAQEVNGDMLMHTYKYTFTSKIVACTHFKPLQITHMNSYTQENQAKPTRDNVARNTEQRADPATNTSAVFFHGPVSIENHTVFGQNLAGSPTSFPLPG